MNEAYRTQLRLQILFDNLFEDKNPKTKQKAIEYSDYLADLITESCDDFIHDNIDNVEEEEE